MTKTIVGLILGLLIGIGCRWFDIPVPSPPKLLGALLVVAMTVGYMATDKVLAARFEAGKAASAGSAYHSKILTSPGNSPVVDPNSLRR
jgi:XapX domain-containing protein